MSEENKTSNQNIIEQPLKGIMQDAYLEYAVSVISDRALPDGRDGLKPVHRRILYSMNDLGITHTAGFKKSARIVGDVLGKYHPHGDTAAYDSMVRLAQPFSMRVPLIQGQGNFGSVDGDAAAAMRYTEARMSKFSSKHMFNDLGKKTVNFIPNYDNEEEEPEVLPLTFPNLLINGGQGIAVGMASMMPPHNPLEVMEVLKKKVTNRLDGVEDNIQEFIEMMPAPDFPTGGHIHSLTNFEDVWTKGRGACLLRSKWDETEVNGRTVVSIKEIPYTVNKFKLVQKIKELVKVDKDSGIAKIEGVSKVEDFSDRKGLEIEIIIKPEYDVEQVMNDLLDSTFLEDTISYNCTVLVKDKESGDFKPEVVGLNGLFDLFIDHRLEVILNRSIFDESKLLAKKHILNGLLKAIDPANIDKVITTIKANKNIQDAVQALMALLDIDEIQAKEVLQIRLSRLVGMERDNLVEELNKINAELDVLSHLIMHKYARLEVILTDSDNMITEFINTQTPDINFYKNLKYPFRERISTFQVDAIRSDKAALTKEESCNIIMTSKGFVKRVPASELSRMNRGSRGKKQIKLTEGAFIQKTISSHSHDDLLFVTDTGRTYTKKAYEITDAEKGRHVNRILDLYDTEEKVIDIMPIDFSDEDSMVAMFTKNGLIKLTMLSEYLGASRKSGVKGVTLKEGDSILCFSICHKDDSLFMVNSNNLIVRFPVEGISVVKRPGSGVIGMRLEDGVSIVGAGRIKNEKGYIVCVSTNGLIKITDVDQYRTQVRGGKGLRVMKANERSGCLFNSFYVEDLEDCIVSVTKNGFSNMRPLKEFTVTNRTTTGVKLLTIEEDDALVDVFKTPFQEESLEDDLESGELESNDEIEDSAVDSNDLDDSIPEDDDGF